MRKATKREAIIIAENQEVVEKIREFNRFYTTLIGILNRNYLETGYSVTENRIMFELYQGREIGANDLTDTLQLDKGYISRIIGGFERKELITRKTSEQDGRKRIIQLTAKGRAEAERLIDITNEKILELIQPLDRETCVSLCQAMHYITESLTGKTNGSKEKKGAQ